TVSLESRLIGQALRAAATVWWLYQIIGHAEHVDLALEGNRSNRSRPGQEPAPGPQGERIAFDLGQRHAVHDLDHANQRPVVQLFPGWQAGQQVRVVTLQVALGLAGVDDERAPVPSWAAPILDGLDPGYNGPGPRLAHGERQHVELLPLSQVRPDAAAL